MARNEEKAQAMLNRWQQMKKDLHKGPVRERPKTHHRIMQLNRLNDCEKYRRQILKEINKNVSIIQNAGLGEHKIRELNDEINKLIKEKGSYELRIKELGGPDYKASVERMYDDEGDILPGSGDYFYFGAAKDLPGVREQFQKKRPEAPRRNMLEIYKGLDYEEYFGKRDDANENLLAAEREAETIARDKELNRWIEENRELITKKLKKKDFTQDEVMQIIEELAYDDSDEEDMRQLQEAGNMDEEDEEEKQVVKNKKKWEDMTEEERYVEKKKNLLLTKYLGLVDKTGNKDKQESDQSASQDNTREKMVEELITMQKEH